MYTFMLALLGSGDCLDKKRPAWPLGIKGEVVTNPLKTTSV